MICDDPYPHKPHTFPTLRENSKVWELDWTNCEGRTTFPPPDPAKMIAPNWDTWERIYWNVVNDLGEPFDLEYAKLYDKIEDFIIAAVAGGVDRDKLYGCMNTDIDQLIAYADGPVGAVGDDPDPRYP